MNYNGWSNQLTWLVHLHLTNDEAPYNDAIQMDSDVSVEMEDADRDVCIDTLTNNLER